MARGRQTRAKKTATKRKTDGKDEAAPAKLQREDSANTKLRLAINEVKAAASTETKKKYYKPDHILLIHHPQATVHEDYSCMLNQTNIGHNNNKFYVIQIVQEKKKNICFTRWGRVGEDGQHNALIEKDAEAAIKSFKKKFKDKTKNDWEKRDNFTPHPGKYTMIEIDDDDEDEEADTVDGGQQLTRTTVTFTGICPLNARTLLMIKLIFSDDMFIGQMSAMHLDIKKMPLGKLSKAQIAKGLEALLDIETAIKNKKPRQVLMDLSSKFYTYCPHDFGRNVPTVLDTESIVQQKKEVMLTLSDIELTQSLQKEKSEKEIHPLLEKYQMLECDMNLLDKKSAEYKLLQEYSSACPDARKSTLLDVWRIDRKGEKERFQAHESLDNRKLLWHGTNVAVVAAILKAGLRIMPHSGGLVGRGIYFASEYAKSCWYARPHCGVFENENNVAFLFLVEVALGKEKSITQSNSSLTKAPPGFDSVVARGSSEPGGGSLAVSDQLKASEEAMLSLLELEAIEGLANIEDSEEFSSMASATIENEEPAPPRTTSAAAYKPPTPHSLTGTSPKRVALAELSPIFTDMDANIFLVPGHSAIREVTVPSVSQETAHVPNDHAYYREEPDSLTNTPRRGQSSSRSSTRALEERASLQRVIETQNETKEALDRHLTRIGDNLTRIGDLLEGLVTQGKRG